MSSSAHAVLFCQELVANICDYLAPFTKAEECQTGRVSPRVAFSNPQRKKALARLSRTCKAFTEPANAVLWRRLQNIEPLMLLFSQVRRKANDWEYFEKNILDEDVPEAEWARFQHYARYVRELYDGGEPDRWDYVRETWTQLGVLADGQPLLPRLRQLWSLQVDSWGPIELPLLSPSVRNLALCIQNHTVGPGSELIRSSLETVLRSTPHLEHFMLNCRDGVHVRLRDLESPIFGNLRSLLFQGHILIDGAGLAKLSQCPYLESLTTTLHIANAEGALPDFECFPALRKASLRGTPGHLATLFSRVSFPRLRELSLNFSTDPAPEVLLASVASVLDKVPRGLTHLQLKRRRRERFYERQPMPLPHALMPIIEPALQLRSLEKVKIAFTYLPSVDDADIARMLAAWPELTALSITPGSLCDPPFQGRKPTAETLVTVANRAPKLLSLQLPHIDMHNACSLLPQLPFPEHALETLTFKTSLERPGKVFDAALLIDRLFPYLQLTEELSRFPGTEAEIDRHLMAMQAGRAHAMLLDELEPSSVVEMYHITDSRLQTVHERVLGPVFPTKEEFDAEEIPPPATEFDHLF